MSIRIIAAVLCGAHLVCGQVAISCGQERSPSSNIKGPRDTVVDAQTPKDVPIERPEQKKTAHDRSDKFKPKKALPTTKALSDQADDGQCWGSTSISTPWARPNRE